MTTSNRNPTVLSTWRMGSQWMFQWLGSLTKHGYSPLTNWDDPPSARQIDSVFFSSRHT